MKLQLGISVLSLYQSIIYLYVVGFAWFQVLQRHLITEHSLFQRSAVRVADRRVDNFVSHCSDNLLPAQLQRVSISLYLSVRCKITNHNTP